MGKFKLNKEMAMGGIFLVISGFIFTLERFFSILEWMAEFVPVQIIGHGSYSTKPSMPGFFDNLFVPLFFAFGTFLFIVGIIKVYKD